MRARAYDLDQALADGTAAPSAVAVLDALTATRARLEEQTALRPDFRDDLRRRLVAVAAVRPVGPAPAAAVPLARPVPTARRRLATALAVAGCAGVVGGLTLATDRSLPGEPLYAAKRATEGLQMRTASNPLERGERHLALAETRLEEVRALAAAPDAAGLGGTRWSASGVASTGRAARIAETLTEMDEQTRLGSEALRRAARASGDAGVLVALRTWTDRQAVGLREVAALLPTQVRERAETSLSVVAVVRRDADAGIAEVCGAGAGGSDCAPLPGAGGPLPLDAPGPSGPGGQPSGPGGPGGPGGTPGPDGPGRPSAGTMPDPDRPGSTPSTSEPGQPGQPGPTDPSPSSSAPDPGPSSGPTPSGSPSSRDPVPEPTGEQDPDATREPTGEPTPAPGGEEDPQSEEPDDLLGGSASSTPEPTDASPSAAGPGSPGPTPDQG